MRSSSCCICTPRLPRVDFAADTGRIEGRRGARRRPRQSRSRQNARPGTLTGRRLHPRSPVATAAVRRAPGAGPASSASTRPAALTAVQAGRPALPAGRGRAPRRGGVATGGPRATLRPGPRRPLKSKIPPQGGSPPACSLAIACSTDCPTCSAH
jgi:hypothetical protein